jgi:hypothetical protein
VYPCTPSRLLKILEFVALLVLLGGSLQSCQSSREPVSASNMGPGEVNAAWLDALERKDRDTALLLFDPLATFRAERVQEFIDDYPMPGRVEDFGTLGHTTYLKLERLQIVTEGEQHHGYLVATYQNSNELKNKVHCQETTIGRVSGEWKVIRWDYATCPDKVVPEWQKGLVR